MILLDDEVNDINNTAIALANATGDVEKRRDAATVLVVLQLGQIAKRLTILAFLAWLAISWAIVSAVL